MDCFDDPVGMTSWAIHNQFWQDSSNYWRRVCKQTKKQKAATLSLITRYSQIGHKSLLIIPKSHHINKTKEACDFFVNTLRSVTPLLEQLLSKLTSSQCWWSVIFTVDKLCPVGVPVNLLLCWGPYNLCTGLWGCALCSHSSWSRWAYRWCCSYVWE